MFETLDLLSWFALSLAVVSMSLLGSAALFALIYMFVGKDRP